MFLIFSKEQQNIVPFIFVYDLLFIVLQLLLSINV